MLKGGLFHHLVTSTMFREAREEADHTWHSLFRGLQLRGLQKEDLECLKYSFFLPEFYCLPKGLSDGIKTELLFSEPETQMTKADYQGGPGTPAFKSYLTPTGIDTLVEEVSEIWQR